MDLSVLASTSENDMQSAGACFTVRSASSPSYTFTRRSGIRRRETAEAAGEREKRGTSVGTSYSNNDGNKRVKDQSVEKDASGSRLTSKLDQNGTADKTTLENSVTDKLVNSVLERRGRAEWRSNLPSRSQSFEWRPRTRSPVQGTRTDLSSKREADFSKNAGGSEERRTEHEINMTGRLTSFLRQDSSPVSYSSLTLDKANKVKSLPSRFRSEYDPDSRSTETSVGPKGVQSIQERIQKLYESAGEKTTGGTFPRRFSTGDNCSPVQTRVSFIWPQKDANASVSETLVSPETKKPKEKSPAKQWQQGSFSSKYSEDVNWSKDMMEMGTKSLDRARSRNTVAAQINCLRTAGEIFGTVQPKAISEYRTGQPKGLEKNKEKAEGAIKQTEPKSVTADEDVFDTNPQKVTLKPAEEKLPETVPSSASVRNKISQFEALTQKATNEVQTPRWTFYTPTQLYKAHDGVKKSRSVKEMRECGDKWEGENRRENWRKLGPERSFSVDEVGLRLMKMETEGRVSADTGKNDFSEDFVKYSRLQKTMYSPLDDGTQRRRRMFYFEPDKFENSSKEETTSKSVPSPHPVPVQLQSAILSPVSNDNETPANVPDRFSFIFSAAQTEKGPAVADNKNKNTSVITQEDETVSPLPDTFSHSNVSDICTTQEEKTDETDFPSLLPATNSKSSTSDVFYPDVKTAYPKGKKQLLDLNAWVAGLNPEYKGWNEYMGHYEDDDESTQKDDDSNYDSDSGDSSVTITSNKSQSDRKSFSLRWVMFVRSKVIFKAVCFFSSNPPFLTISLAELCNFSGVEYESDTDANEWEQHNRRSASMSSDMSVFSCVSLMPAEELDKLLEDVRDLGDETLQV